VRGLALRGLLLEAEEAPQLAEEGQQVALLLDALEDEPLGRDVVEGSEGQGDRCAGQADDVVRHAEVRCWQTYEDALRAQLDQITLPRPVESATETRVSFGAPVLPDVRAAFHFLAQRFAAFTMDDFYVWMRQDDDNTEKTKFSSLIR
jgi:hypothetical protein